MYYVIHNQSGPSKMVPRALPVSGVEKGPKESKPISNCSVAGVIGISDIPDFSNSVILSLWFNEIIKLGTVHISYFKLKMKYWFSDCLSHNFVG